MKILAIHGGGDWNDASADYLSVPDDFDNEAATAEYRQWYTQYAIDAKDYGVRMERCCFTNAEREAFRTSVPRPIFLTYHAWLKQFKGLEEPGNELIITHE